MLSVDARCGFSLFSFMLMKQHLMLCCCMLNFTSIGSSMCQVSYVFKNPDVSEIVIFKAPFLQVPYYFCLIILIIIFPISFYIMNLVS